MEILGLGTQVMECARVRRLLLADHADAFLRQVYTDREVRYCQRHKGRRPNSSRPYGPPRKRCSARSAPPGSAAPTWTDVEVVCEPGAPPHAVVSGATRDLLAARGVNHILLTMAFCRTFATATAVAGRAAAAAGARRHRARRLKE